MGNTVNKFRLTSRLRRCAYSSLIWTTREINIKYDLIRNTWRDGAVVGSCSGRVVCVGPGQVVGELSRTLEHLASLVGAVLDHLLGRHGLYLGLGVSNVHQIAERDVLQAVAGRANLQGW